MKNDLISIIVPVFKTEKYINRCIDSILAQSYDNFEIILVDDGSPDECPSICDELSKKNNKVRTIHKINGGLSSARNAGIDAAQGSYISFIDSDDFIDEDMLLRLYETIIEYNADVAMVKYTEVYDSKVQRNLDRKEAIVFHNNDVETAFLRLRIESVCVGLYSRNAIGDIRFIEGKTHEDIPFNFAVFKKINTFAYLPERRYYYFYNSLSISNGVLNSNMFNLIQFRMEICEYYKETNLELFKLAEVLYARAAMALLTRMAVYGTSKEINTKESKKNLINILKQRRKTFFSSVDVPFSRKILAFLCLRAYFLLKILGGFKR